jgi:hypothetical protein
LEQDALLQFPTVEPSEILQNKSEGHSELEVQLLLHSGTWVGVGEGLAVLTGVGVGDGLEDPVGLGVGVFVLFILNTRD